MDVIFTHGAGLDVHKKSVMACRLVPDPTGKQADGLMEVRACGTLTINLLALSDGLAEAGITHVAMESPAEYWRGGPSREGCGGLSAKCVGRHFTIKDPAHG